MVNLVLEKNVELEMVHVKLITRYNSKNIV